MRSQLWKRGDGGNGSQSLAIPSDSGIGILPMNLSERRVEADATGSRCESFKVTGNFNGIPRLSLGMTEGRERI